MNFSRKMALWSRTINLSICVSGLQNKQVLFPLENILMPGIFPECWKFPRLTDVHLRSHVTTKISSMVLWGCVSQPRAATAVWHMQGTTLTQVVRFQSVLLTNMMRRFKTLRCTTNYSHYFTHFAFPNGRGLSCLVILLNRTEKDRSPAGLKSQSRKEALSLGLKWFRWC